MRISDWSSDVCSSDLVSESLRVVRWMSVVRIRVSRRVMVLETVAFARPNSSAACRKDPFSATFAKTAQASKSGRRSEEHTSELQSLMRISYAVFCLKKKKDTIKHPSNCAGIVH